MNDSNDIHNSRDRERSDLAQPGGDSADNDQPNIDDSSIDDSNIDDSSPASSSSDASRLVDEPVEAGLIFDCDGTLADTMPLHFLAWQSTLNRYGIEFSEDRFYSMAGQPTVFITQTLMREQSVSGDAEAIADEKERAFVDLLPQVQPIEPIVQIARHFRPTRRMGVGSGSCLDTVLQVLHHIGLEDFFDAVVAAEDVAGHKPEPDVFLEVARRLQVDADQCRVYEDADLGLEAASRAGMSSFDIRTVFTPRRMS